MHITADSLIAALRERGVRVTRPRRAVCEVIAASHGIHLTAAAIHERAGTNGTPHPDLSTIYRTLDVLEDAGLVYHSHMGHGPAVYHLADEQPHQHLICRSCGRTVSIRDRDLAEITREITELTGFTVEAEHFALSGLCRDCATH